MLAAFAVQTQTDQSWMRRATKGTARLRCPRRCLYWTSLAADRHANAMAASVCYWLVAFPVTEARARTRGQGGIRRHSRSLRVGTGCSCWPSMGNRRRRRVLSCRERRGPAGDLRVKGPTARRRSGRGTCPIPPRSQECEHVPPCRRASAAKTLVRLPKPATLRRWPPVHAHARVAASQAHRRAHLGLRYVLDSSTQKPARPTVQGQEQISRPS